MKNQLILILILGMSLPAFQSCKDKNCIDGSGPIVTVELDVPAFSGISTSGTHDIYIENGTPQKVIAIGQQNIIDQLELDVNSGIWDASLRGDCYHDYELTLYVTIPEIDWIESSGTGDYYVKHFEDLESLNIMLSGTGGIFQDGSFGAASRIDISSTGTGVVDLDLFTPLLTVSQTGTGNVVLTGSVRTQNVTITGTGNYACFGLASDTCTIVSTGTGNAQIVVQDLLNATLTGTGDVFYKGTPQINRTITGTGDLVDAN